MYTKSLVLLMVSLFASIAACTPIGSDSEVTFEDETKLASKKAFAASSSDQTSPMNTQNMAFEGQSHNENMAVFEGSIFVATTDLVTNLWEAAGWSISNRPIDTESEEVPKDCTLYPHSGVTSQWIGSCTGYILVPRAGAAHIGVMVTNPDGSTTMFQVAPPPDTPQN